VPVHARESISFGLLLKIMKDAKIEREEFVKLLAKTLNPICQTRKIIALTSLSRLHAKVAPAPAF
jgi:hypothetical protein